MSGSFKTVQRSQGSETTGILTNLNDIHRNTPTRTKAGAQPIFESFQGSLINNIIIESKL